MQRRTLASPAIPGDDAYDVFGELPAAFASSGLTGGGYSEDPANPNRIIAATYARGVWAYTFK
jgi:hypothetical protein